MLLLGWSKRRRAGEARELLAAAGGVFDRSLDPLQTMRAIAELVVPRLAPMCTVDLFGDDGSVTTTVAVSERQELVERFNEMRARHPPDMGGEHPIARAIRYA